MADNFIDISSAQSSIVHCWNSTSISSLDSSSSSISLSPKKWLHGKSLTPTVLGQLSQQYIMQSFDDLLQTLISVKEYDFSSSIALSISLRFWWIVHTHTEWVPFGQTLIHHFDLRLANFENPILLSGYLDLYAIKISVTL